MTGKERVYRTLRFQKPDRIPVQMWALPATWYTHGDAFTELRNEVKARSDFASAGFSDPTANPHIYDVGVHTDIWGCVWHNHQPGIVGEVKGWPLADDAAIDGYVSPAHLLKAISGEQANREAAPAVAANADKFIACGGCRVFEQMQFLRGTENLFMDIAAESDEFFKIRDIVMEFALEQVRLAAAIEGGDSFAIFDDWGSQRALLISPDAWRKLFKPCYKRLIDVLKAAGKTVFFHSDGYVLDLYEEWIDLGVDAVNTQLTCMGVENVGAKIRGRMTAWGELDRQQIMRRGTTQDVQRLIDSIIEHIATPEGGLIGQFEAIMDMPMPNIRQGLFGWHK